MSSSIGFLNVNKPSGMTSHDVVAQVRRHSKQTTGIKKVGHAGTLDPSATGVLVLCIGHATRLSEYVMQSTKQYRAQVYLGIMTDTYDSEGQILSQEDAQHITLDEVQALLPQFTGTIQQIPPMYSAIKQDGKKLYELARQGKSVERPPRIVHIEAIEIVEWNSPHFTLDVTCSAGTYIRSLAYDIGNLLGIGAHLAGLIRTRSGTFSLENSVVLDTLIENQDWQSYLISPQTALADWRTLHLTADQAVEITYGRQIANDSDWHDKHIMAYSQDGQLLAVLENRGERWKPHKVFLPIS